MLRKLILMLAFSLGAFAPTAQSAGIQLFSNNAVTTLTSSASSGTTTLTVASSTGFPTLSGGNWFEATLEHLVSGIVTAQEIVEVTAVSGSTWTVVRAQEGTPALSWITGDTVALLPTAGGLSQFLQAPQAQPQSYNYAVDSGTANAYSVTLTPAVSAHVAGMPIRWKALHTNTGASTFSDGAGAVALTLPSGAALSGGEITAGAIVSTVWDGGKFQLVGSVGNAIVSNPVGSSAQAINGASLSMNNPNAQYQLFNTSSAANGGKWSVITGTCTFNINAYSDDFSTATSALTATRSCTSPTVTIVALGGTSQTGTTQTTGDNSINFATTAFLQNTLGASPALGGAPTAPTTANATNNTQVATTAFVQNVFTQNVGSTNIGYQPTGVSGIGSGYTAIIANTPLAAGVYAVEYDGDLVTSGAGGALSSRVLITTGTGTGNPVATIGGGSSSVINNSNAFDACYGNAAGMTGCPMYAATTQHAFLRGTFTMPSGATSVTFELAVSAGSMAASAGSYAKFTRLN